MSDKLDQLKAKLRELFQLDRPDLDFGFYRIMHAKQHEIDRFLDKDLLPQVQAGLASLKVGNSELEDAIKQAKELGIDPDSSPKVRVLKAKMGEPIDPAKTEDETYSHLYRFFSRYYDNGDFISMRRYKEGVYAIPYEGEEVVLHWANKDQYYIKSSENLRDYTVKLAAGDDSPRLQFKLVKADIEKDNVKAAADKNRLFIFNPEKTEILPASVTFGFEYRHDPENRKQEVFASACVDYVKSHLTDFGDFASLLLAPAATEKRRDRTMLEKHLADYTSKNTMDYFIHKDLGGFLHRELDFYIKNEVMHLDDIENESAPRVEQYLAQVRVIRGIAHKLIDFLAQLEDFQKKLWLKKKFVVETNWCITLDRMPETLYPEIAANDAQWAEWRKLGFLDIEKPKKEAGQKELGLGDQELPTVGTVEYLKAFPYMVIDSALYDDDFKQKLLASIEDIDARTDGLLIHSENFQALQLIQERYQDQVKCVYIDPPYNTASSEILYKNAYKHSSWGTLMRDRCHLLARTMRRDGAMFVSIDKHERSILEQAMDQVFGPDNHIEELIWSMNTNNGQAPNYSTNHEYVQVYAKDRATAEADKAMFREPKPGFETVMELINRLNPQYPSIPEIEEAVRKLYEQHRVEFREEIEAQGLEWDDEKSNDPWKGLFNYTGAEYRDAMGSLVEQSSAHSCNARIWIWRASDISMPATKQSATTRDPSHPNWRYYRPSHPTTGQPCPHPKSGWKFAYNGDEDSPDKKSFVSLDRDKRIVWGKDEQNIPQLKRFLNEVESNVSKSVFSDYSDGEKQTSALFGLSGMFLAPKHANFVSRFILQSTKKDSIVVDCFGGSGSTAHAVISVNRAERSSRKYLTVEMGNHFKTIIVPRLKKVVYSSDWKDGKPVDPTSGVSHCFKYLRLESYEDCLNNLELKRTGEQDDLLNRNAGLKEDYTLRYMLDVESRDSLLNVSAFADPFNYTLKVATSSVGETKPQKVDLVETFNYLIGLKVKTMDAIRGVTVVTGENLKGDKILVLWRNTSETDSEALNRWFVKQGYNTQDMEFDIIYVNGDNNLENLRRDEQTWKVRLTEEEFLRRMFAGEEV